MYSVNSIIALGELKRTGHRVVTVVATKKIKYAWSKHYQEYQLQSSKMVLVRRNLNSLKL